MKTAFFILKAAVFATKSYCDRLNCNDETSPASEQEPSLLDNEMRKSDENFRNDTFPEPSATETPPVRQVVRDAEFISKITRTMTEQLRQKHFAEVCLLLRSSAPYDETGELAALSELMEFALGDPAVSPKEMVMMSKLTNDLQKLQESEDDWSPMVSCLRVAGNLRLLCVGRKDRDYERYHLDKEMQSCLDDENMSDLPHLKETFNLLRALIKNTNLNLEEACAMDDSSSNRNPLSFPKIAADFLERTRQLSKKQYEHEKVNDVLHRFYRADPIIKLMEKAEQDDISQSGACMKFCSDFLAKNQTLPASIGDVTVWSDQAIDNYIDKLWDASRVKTQQKNDKFKGDLRNTTTKNFKEMLSILACWSDNVEMRDRSGTDIISWRQKSLPLKQAFQKLEAECDALQDEESLLEPFVNILGYIAHEYGEILSKGISARNKRYFYLSFLHTCHVELEEREGAYLPVKEEDISDLPESRLCERVLKHCQEPLPPWQEVVRSIFLPADDEDDSKCDDFGHARLIWDYLTEQGEKTEEIWPQTFSLETSVALVSKNINQEYERFIGDVETALNRGQLQLPNENERSYSSAYHNNFL